MKVRLTGIPAEVSAAVDQLTADGWRFRSVSKPYPCRGASVEVRVYVEVLDLPTQPRGNQ
jgi:hypothetical protein